MTIEIATLFAGVAVLKKACILSGVLNTLLPSAIVTAISAGRFKMSSALYM